jgi:arylformamidase
MLARRMVMFKGALLALALARSAEAARRGEGPDPTAADLPYVSGSSDPQQTLDVSTQSGGGSGRAVVVYVHGGGWGRGDKRLGRSMAPLFLERGHVFVSLNYRLAPQNKYPVFMRDLAAAMRWVKDNIGRHGGSPDRIVLVGHSAGAHLVALLGTDPQFLREQNLPVNMFRAVVPIDTASFNFLVDPYGMLVNRQKKIREDAFGTDRATLTAASPTLVAAKAKPGTLSPFSIWVSSKRPDAIEQSEAFAKALRDSGNQASVSQLDLGHARMNQALGDRESPLARAVLERLGKG